MGGNIKTRKPIRIGTRGSPLALKQVEEIGRLWEAISKNKATLKDKFNFIIKPYATSGDKDKITPISEMEGTDFFTDTIEQGLLNKEIDIAIHSAKDLPDVIPSRLIIAALTKSIDPTDALISKKNLKLEELPVGAKIGVSSQRRKEQLKKFRADLQAVDLRGNIEERLAKLDGSNLDAIILASAALIRLGLENRITQKLLKKIFEPHPLQGSLAIETRQNEPETISLFNQLDTRIKILFACIENSCRSQIAEALVNHFYWQKFIAFSAGSKPSGQVNPLAIEVMKEKGVDIANAKSKGFAEFLDIQFDYVITMGCGDECPVYPAKQKLDWQIPDPKDKSISFFRQVRDEIESKIRELK